MATDSSVLGALYFLDVDPHIDLHKVEKIVINGKNLTKLDKKRIAARVTRFFSERRAYSKLAEITISYIPLKEIDFDIHKFPKLTHLELFSNEIERISFTNTFGPENQHPLSTINLIDNKLSEIPENVQNLTNLKTLLLTKNHITSLPALSMPNLSTIDVSNNELSEIPDIRNLEKLETLVLNNNRLISSKGTTPERMLLSLRNLELDGIENAEIHALIAQRRPPVITLVKNYDDIQPENLLEHEEIIISDQHSQHAISFDESPIKQNIRNMDTPLYFYLGERFVHLTKNEIRSIIYDNKKSFKYVCPFDDEQQSPYIDTAKFGVPVGYVKLSQLKKALETKTIKIITFVPSIPEVRSMGISCEGSKIVCHCNDEHVYDIMEVKYTMGFNAADYAQATRHTGRQIHPQSPRQTERNNTSASRRSNTSLLKRVSNLFSKKRIQPLGGGSRRIRKQKTKRVRKINRI